MRARALAVRAAVSSPERDLALAARAEEFLAPYPSVFVYLSAGTEADTAALLRALRAGGKRVCVPLVEGKEMRSVPYTDKLAVGAFGILQPEAGEETTCNAAVVPLLMADGTGNRLGYGGGYYDRYFALHPGVIRVGYGYSAQLVDRLPREPHDLPLDFLITEEKVIRFGSRTLDSGTERGYNKRDAAEEEGRC